jgi:hypothetical protein
MTGKSFATLLIGVTVAAFASQASAQPDVPATAHLSGHARISAHRRAALEKCTSGIKFSSRRYVACMMGEGETP